MKTKKSLYVKLLLSVISIVFITSNLNAQELQEVVYLNNGSVIRGVIIEQVPGESLKIQTADGSVFVYKMDEVEKITKEEPLNTKMKLSPNNQNLPGKVQPMGKTELLINPLGVLQFGPIIDFNFNMGNFSIGPHLRMSSLGLLYHVITDYDELDMGSAAIGISFKNYFGYSQDKFYAGGILEYGWGSGMEEGYYDYWYDHEYFSILSNFGYRWRYDSGFFLNVGAIVGPAFATVEEYDYYSDETWIIFMAELSIGWEF